MEDNDIEGILGKNDSEEQNNDNGNNNHEDDDNNKEQQDSSSGNDGEGGNDPTNLIVNYLPQSVGEEELRNLFKGFGEIEAVKLMTDRFTRQTLGYGFVKYVGPQGADAAANAIAQLSGKEFDGKRLKVGYARPASVMHQQANLYVGGLDTTITPEDLKKAFSRYGTVVDSKVLKDHQTGESRGVGFVRMDQKTQAEVAIAALDGQTMPGNSKAVQVKFADNGDKSQKQRQAPTRGHNTRTNYGQNYHGRGGGVSVDRYTPYPSTFVDPTAFGAGLMYPYMAFPHAQQQQLPAPPRSNDGFCLFIYNLPTNTDESGMYRLFSPYGAVVNVKVVRDFSTQQCKGYGFVNYSRLEEAQQAITHLNNCQLGDKVLQVSFKSSGGGKNKREQY